MASAAVIEDDNDNCYFSIYFFTICSSLPFIDVDMCMVAVDYISPDLFIYLIIN